MYWFNGYFCSDVKLVLDRLCRSVINVTTYVIHIQALNTRFRKKSPWISLRSLDTKGHTTTGFRTSEWLRWRRALYEQNISTVKMATSEPVRETRNSGKIDRSAWQEKSHLCYIWQRCDMISLNRSGASYLSGIVVFQPFRRVRSRGWVLALACKVMEQPALTVGREGLTHWLDVAHSNS